MASTIVLTARPRDDQKPKALRRSGFVPGVLYGPAFETRTLQFEMNPLLRVLRQAGTSRLIDLDIEGTETHETVLVRAMQRDPVTGRMLHIDLYRTQAGQVIRLSVPLVQVGEAPAVAEEGFVSMPIDELEIECLPRDVPEAIHVDLSVLVDMHTVITVADLPIPEGVTVLLDTDTVIARASLPTAAMEVEEEEVVELAAEEVLEREEQAPEAEAGEEETPA